MSMELMDEHEQGERVRAWLKENGSSIVTGILLGIAGIVGWNWWTANQATQKQNAATQYAELTRAVERNDRDGVQALLQAIEKDYGSTTYSTLAALQWADLQVQAGELAGAVETLQKAKKDNHAEPLSGVIDARLARVMLANGDAEGAKKLLTQSGKSALTSPMTDDLLGDVEASLGNRDAAVKHWQAAYKAYEETAPSRRLVEMKLLDLGVTAEAEAPAAEKVDA